MKRIPSVALGRHLLVIAGLALASSVSSLSAADTYYVSDHLATTTAVADAAGEIASLEADAFGSPVSGGEQAARYTGKPYDADIGAYVFPFRNYRSDEARWMSADPSGFPDGTNSQSYANMSANSLDPLGLKIYTGIYNGTYSMIYVQDQFRVVNYSATYTSGNNRTESLNGSLALGYGVGKAEIAAASGISENLINTFSSSSTNQYQNNGQPKVKQFGGKQPGQVSVADLGLPAGATFVEWSGDATMDEPTWGDAFTSRVTDYIQTRTQMKTQTWSRSYKYEE